MKGTILVAALLMAPSLALAGGYRGWGPRAGITSDPDQVYFGAHLDVDGPGDHVRFQPNVEVGVGDHLTLVAFNAELAYRFDSDWDRWSPYLGGGLGLNVTGDGEGVLGNSDTRLGASFLGGIEKGLSSGNSVFLESKIGLADSPDVKFAVGWTFYR
jgi:hypothetical protein